MRLPPKRWLAMALVLLLGACTRGSEIPQRPSLAPPSPFDAIVRDFPYRAPPSEAKPGTLGEIAAVPKPSNPNGRVVAPLALTTSDGAGLEVRRLEARVLIDSMLAFTELRLAFLNPEARVREGRFTLQLPAGAAISRLAMKVNGVWQEAEVVERRHATRVYEDFLHQRQDPALLEKAAGNQFSARVFPIPPHAEKEIIVSYSEELEQQEYRLPLAGMPRIGELVVRAQVLDEPGCSVLLGPRTEHVLEHDFVPEEDFRLPLDRPFVALSAGQLVAIPIRLAPRIAFEPMQTLALAFDTSASRALDLSNDVKRLGELLVHLVELHPGLKLTVFAFDQELRPIFSGPAKGFHPRELDRVLNERALGASDLSLALEALGRSQARRVALFTDAVPTATALADRSLAGPLTSMEARGVRIDVVLSGAAHDRATARTLVRGGGRVLGSELSAAELARRLSSSAAADLAPWLPNAEWIHPRLLEAVEPGEIRTIHARLKHPPNGPLRVIVTSSDVGEARSAAPAAHVLTIPSRTGERVLLERSVAGAEIRRVASRLAATKLGAAEQGTLKGTIVELSRRYRVLSDWTALLVLESDDDYERYGIDRNALSDIVSIGERGFTAVGRAHPVGGGLRLEQLTEPSAPIRALKSSPPAQPQATPQDGYGYEFSDDPLSESLLPGLREDTKTGIDDICAIDPGACPSLEMNKGARAQRQAALRSCRSGPLRRWAAGIPRQAPCQRPTSTAPRAWQPGVLIEPYAGRFAEVMRLIVSGALDRAQREALAWRDAEPADTLALVALGEALEAAGKRNAAARAYGSLIDLYPARADMRRFAAGRLERLGSAGIRLSEDAYRRALEQRPDHTTSHQLLAYSLLRQGRAEEAFAVLERHLLAGAIQSRELLEDLRLVAAVLIARAPKHKARALAALERYGLEPAHGRSTRVLLTWETDTNDVDLHLIDRNGEHAFYERRGLPDGGILLTDVVTGYGPEEFVLGPGAAGSPYQVFVHYYASGPMGFGMGKVDVIDHDGDGNVSVDTRPFVILNEDATVHLGQLTRSTTLTRQLRPGAHLRVRD
ncbi:MAG TPA: VIT domain-containing protein [Polyangiaceae bacterium]|nr:VIT domain-containing protein [Polyangiaceae bacterium]